MTAMHEDLDPRAKRDTRGWRAVAAQKRVEAANAELAYAYEARAQAVRDATDLAHPRDERWTEHELAQLMEVRRGLISYVKQQQKGGGS